MPVQLLLGSKATPVYVASILSTEPSPQPLVILFFMERASVDVASAAVTAVSQSSRGWLCSTLDLPEGLYDVPSLVPAEFPGKRQFAEM